MLEATKMGDTIAKQAGAINGESGLKLSVGCFDDVRPIDVAQAVNARAVCTVPQCLPPQSSTGSTA